MARAGATFVHEAARRKGLGEVRRIYRERNPLWTKKTYVIGGVAAVGMLIGALPDSRWRWPVMLLGPVLAVGIVAAYTFFSRVTFVARRRLIGVSDLGVLVYCAGYRRVALRWEEIDSVVRESRYRYVINGVDGTRIEFRDIHDGKSFMAAVAAERPMRAPWRRRAVVGMAAVVVVILLGWASLQQAFGVAQVLWGPGKFSDFVKVCEDPGAAFRGAASYAAVPPRPVVIVNSGLGSSWRGSGPWGPASPKDVQVVVCVGSRSGSGEVVTTCQYQAFDVDRAPRTVRFIQGVYEVTAFEARTRKLIRTSTLKGSHGGCPESIRSQTVALYGTVGEEDLRRAFGDIVGPT